MQTYAPKPKKKTANPYSGSRISLSGTLAEQINSSFGLSADELQIRESPEVAAMGASATAQGNVIRFAPGMFRPNTKDGLTMLGHELSHIKAQAKGGLHPDAPDGTLTDIGQESAGDREGMAFAEGTMANASPVSLSGSSAYGAPVQMWPGKKKKPAPAPTTQNSPEPELYASLDEELKAKYKNVQYKGNRSNFLVEGKNRESKLDDPNPFQQRRNQRGADMREVSRRTGKGLANISPERVGAIAAVAGDKMALAKDTTYVEETGNAFGSLLDLIEEYAGGEEGKADIRDHAKAFRGATRGRKGEQDVFGNDDTLAQVMINNMGLFGASTNMTEQSNALPEGPEQTAIRKVGQGSQFMLNYLFVHPFTGDPTNEADIQAYVDQLNEKARETERNPESFTVPLVKRYLNLMGQVKGSFGEKEPEPENKNPEPEKPFVRQSNQWFDDAEDTIGVAPENFTPQQRGKLAHQKLERMKQEKEVDPEERERIVQELIRAKDDYLREQNPQPQSKPKKKSRFKFWK